MIVGELIQSRSPTHPFELVGEFPYTSAAEVHDALTAAVKVQPEWARSTAERSLALDAWANRLSGDEELATLMAREVGKPLVEARAEVLRTIAILRYYAQAAYDPIGDVLPVPRGGGWLRSVRYPIGTVLAITPWNFPVAIPAWKIAPALAYGNTVIFRPSTAAVATARRLLDHAVSVLPPGVLTIIVTRADSVLDLVADSRIAGVSFTGSIPVGQHLIRAVAGRGAAVQAELGGQNAAIVLDDADLEPAAAMIAASAMAYAGQKCTATSRVLVSRGVLKDFMGALIEAVRRLKVGDPLDEAVTVGPVISHDAQRQIESAVASAIARGAKDVVGASRQPEHQGWFIDPVVLLTASALDPINQEEVFGPVVSLLAVDDDDSAVGVANGVRHGLVASVFSRDLGRAMHIGERLAVGLVRINAPTTGVDFHAPFGGEKASSYGSREQGKAAREFYTRTRTLFMNI